MPEVRLVRAFIVGLALFLLGGTVALVVFAGWGRAPSRQQGASLFDTSANPIGPGAVQSSGVPPNSDALPFTALLPKSSDPSTDVKTSWIRVEIEPAFAVELASGVRIMERAAEAIDFPTDKYYEQLGEGVPGASIEQINGAAALVIQSNTDLGNPSGVDLILQGVHISIIGAVGQDVSELVTLAGSIPATGAA